MHGVGCRLPVIELLTTGILSPVEAIFVVYTHTMATPQIGEHGHRPLCMRHTCVGVMHAGMSSEAPIGLRLVLRLTRLHEPVKPAGIRVLAGRVRAPLLRRVVQH